MVGFIISWALIFRLFETVEPHFRTMQNDTPAIVQETVVERYFIVELNGENHRLSFFGMDIDQWIELAKMIVKSNYAYNQTQFESLLGRVEEKGRNIYYAVSGAMNYGDVFLVVYGNGYKLTDAGKEFMDKVAKGDWRVLNELSNE